MNKPCTIRKVSEADLKQILEWRNHLEVRQFMLNRNVISLREHIQWFARMSKDPNKRMYIVEELGKPLGFVQFDNACAGGVSNWGFYAVPNSPKGTGMKIGIAVLNHAFLDLQLHKVCGQAIATNEASIKFHNRLGFRQEGVLREQHRFNDCYHTMVCFGLLASEWRFDL